MGDELFINNVKLSCIILQPTPLQWGELPFAVACVGNPKFQPISHLRGQLKKAQLFIWYMAILIHIPVWG